MEGILRPRPGLLARLRALLAGGPEEGEAPLIPDAARALRQHGDAVLRLACSYLHQRPEAEDVLQDTLLQYLQKAPPFSGEEHERAWLLRVPPVLLRGLHHRGDRPDSGGAGVHRPLPAGPGPGEAAGRTEGGV